MSRIISKVLAGLFLFLGLWGIGWPPAFATMVLPMNLKDMSRQSEKIFVGRCREVSIDLDENRMPSTYARFDVVKGIKGAESGEQVLIKQFGVNREPLNVLEGERALVPMKTMTVGGGAYQEGEEYLLFLYPESSLGFTSPVGAGQGRFQVSTDTAGLRTAVNPLNNRNLKVLREGPVGLDELIRRVEGLVVHEQ